MKLSKKGFEFIKDIERFHAKAWLSPLKEWVLGYGHKKNVQKGDKITIEKAEELLKRELLTYEAAISRNCKVNLSQHQFDALVSFVFSVGLSNFNNSALLRLVNAGNFTAAGEQFVLWVTDTFCIIPYLQERREKEQQLFLKGTYKQKTQEKANAR